MISQSLIVVGKQRLVTMGFINGFQYAKVATNKKRSFYHPSLRTTSGENKEMMAKDRFQFLAG